MVVKPFWPLGQLGPLSSQKEICFFDMASSRFSLSRLLQLATIVSVIFAVVVIVTDRRHVVQLERQKKHLEDQAGIIPIASANKVHFRRLRYSIPMTIEFQLYVPNGKDYYLHVGEGPIEHGSKFPERLLTRRISSLGKQGTIRIHIRQRYSSWSIEELGDITSGFARVSDSSERFVWLEESFDASLDRTQHDDYFVVDSDDSVVLFQTSENEEYWRRGNKADNPREFMIWIDGIDYRLAR